MLGSKFTVYSDHKPLENLNIRVRTDEELGDLTFFLSQYDFNIVYSQGASNQEADCLSRNPVLEPLSGEKDEFRVVNFISRDDILADQKDNIKKENGDLSPIILENGIWYYGIIKRTLTNVQWYLANFFIK